MTGPSVERGSVTAFTTIAAFALMVATGLTLDGATILGAHRQAADVARAAARAGAQAIDVGGVRTSPRSDLDAGAGVTAASRFLSSTGHHGRTVVRGQQVRVTVTLRRPLAILSLIGLRTVTVSETAEARAVRGVTRGEN